MPLTKKGEKIRENMREEYGSKAKGDAVFYASENKGTIKGVHKGGKRIRRQTRKGMYKKYHDQKAKGPEE